MSRFFFQKTIATAAMIAGWLASGFGQADSIKHNAFENLSLKDLLNVKIISASKKAEYLFDAPVSASVITKRDIRRSVCTSVMEALRLAPGLIVREQSNGNYDIHIRGMDNVPPNAAIDVSANTTTLVMIDDRPVYNYLKGGTFWETLPVDINDVERIEITRGPASPLYGPNAVSGVIHIITRDPQKAGLYAVANVKHGKYNTAINNASLGYRWTKWSIIASGNYQSRDRSQTSYYSIYQNKWLESSASFTDIYKNTITDMGARYPDPHLSQKKYAGNLFLHYSPDKKKSFDLDAGITHAMAQRVISENVITPFSTAHSDGKYVNFRAKIQGLSAQLSYQAGIQDLMLVPGFKYDFHVIDGSLEYTIEIGKLSFKPGLSYRSATYDDTRYSDVVNKKGLFNNKGVINGSAASLRSEYQLLQNKLRLIAAVRADQFNHPDPAYFSYQFAGTYTHNRKNLFRMTYSRSQRSPFNFDTYVDQEVAYYPSGYRKFTKIVLEGSKSVKLLTSIMAEIGYRARLTPALVIDVEVFDTRTRDHRAFVMNGRYKEVHSSDTIYIRPIISQNLPLVLYQKGITASLHYYKNRLYLKSFVTLQESRMKNYSEYMNTANDIPGANNNYNPAQHNIYSGMGVTTKVKSTPVVSGGAMINVGFHSQFNGNLSAYYYSGQTFYHMSNHVLRDGIRGIDRINGKLILNAKVSFELENNIHIFCGAKNLLNDTSREFFRSDEVPFQILAGLNYEF